VLLNGWKDIANHVQRGVRTIQRRERNLGFPVQLSVKGVGHL